MMIFGLKVADGDSTLVIAACDGVPDEALELALWDALCAIRAGRVDHR